LGCVNPPLCLEKHTRNMFEMRPFHHVFKAGPMMIWLSTDNKDKRCATNICAMILRRPGNIRFEESDCAK